MKHLLPYLKKSSFTEYFAEHKDINSNLRQSAQGKHKRKAGENDICCSQITTRFHVQVQGENAHGDQGDEDVFALAQDHMHH